MHTHMHARTHTPHTEIEATAGESMETEAGTEKAAKGWTQNLKVNDVSQSCH